MDTDGSSDHRRVGRLVSTDEAAELALALRIEGGNLHFVEVGTQELPTSSGSGASGDFRDSCGSSFESSGSCSINSSSDTDCRPPSLEITTNTTTPKGMNVRMMGSDSGEEEACVRAAGCRPLRSRADGANGNRDGMMLTEPVVRLGNMTIPDRFKSVSNCYIQHKPTGRVLTIEENGMISLKDAKAGTDEFAPGQTFQRIFYTGVSDNPPPDAPSSTLTVAALRPAKSSGRRKYMVINSFIETDENENQPIKKYEPSLEDIPPDVIHPPRRPPPQYPTVRTDSFPCFFYCHKQKENTYFKLESSIRPNYFLHGFPDSSRLTFVHKDDVTDGDNLSFIFTFTARGHHVALWEDL